MASPIIQHGTSLSSGNGMKTLLLWIQATLPSELTKSFQLPRTIMQNILTKLTTFIKRTPHYQLLEQAPLSYPRTPLQRLTDLLLLTNPINFSILNFIQTEHALGQQQGHEARIREIASHQRIKHLSFAPLIITPTLLNMRSEPHIRDSLELTPSKENIEERMLQEQEAEGWVYSDAFLKGNVFTLAPPGHTRAPFCVRFYERDRGGIGNVLDSGEVFWTSVEEWVRGDERAIGVWGENWIWEL